MHQVEAGETAQCPMCGKTIAWDEYVNECCMCSECFKEWAKEDIERGVI